MALLLTKNRRRRDKNITGSSSYFYGLRTSCASNIAGGLFAEKQFFMSDAPSSQDGSFPKSVACAGCFERIEVERFRCSLDGVSGHIHYGRTAPTAFAVRCPSCGDYIVYDEETRLQSAMA